MNEDISLKILILGNIAVGKTSFLYRYVEEYFPESYLSTIGVDMKNKIIKKKNTNIKLNIWDTCGQERFRSLTKTFIQGTDGIIFLYDITNKESFTNIKYWLLDSQKLNPNFKKIIVGNKIDLQDRIIQTEKMEKYCKENNIIGMEASAKTGVNVSEAFDTLINLIIGNMTKEELIKKFGKVDLNKAVLNANKKPKKRLC